MSKKAAEHHKKASEHHTHAAHHHGEAAKHYDGPDTMRRARTMPTRREDMQLTPDIIVKRQRKLIPRNTVRSKRDG
jgi:hypothetical protein